MTAPIPALPFTARERRLVNRLATPADVQAYLNALPYNTEPPPGAATLRSFRGVVKHGTAHCLEAAITAAVVLEQHGYPPVVMSLESIDELDHVVFIYQQNGKWGSVGRSRDPGLHGRRPAFASPRALALSYFDPYIDRTGCLKGFGVADLRELGAYDWRLATHNVWKVERHLFEVPHRPISWSRRRLTSMRKKYAAFLEANGGRKPIYYDRRAWTAIPRHFTD